MDNKLLLSVKRYQSAVGVFLLVSLLTVINIVTLIAKLNFYFPFSAFFPQLIVAVGQEFSTQLGGSSYLIISILISVVILAFYVLSSFLSKKHYGFMITNLVLFSADTLLMLYFVFQSFSAAVLIDIAFHAWVMYSLIMAVVVGAKLKKTAPNGVATTLVDLNNIRIQEERAAFEKEKAAAELNGSSEFAFTEQQSAEDPRFDLIDTPTLRAADGKGKVYIHVENNGSIIEVKRKFGLTELIINGNVVAEKKGIVEFSQYELTANYANVSYRMTFYVASTRAIMELYADGKMISTISRLA